MFASTQRGGGKRIRESGQIMIMTAVLLPVLMGIGGLALDLSYLYGQRQATQAAADAAAQAGAIALAEGGTATTATTDAIQYAKSNGFTISSSNVTIPPTLDSVKVTVSTSISPILSGILRPSGFTSTVSAVANSTKVSNLGSTGAMWILNPTQAGALQVNDHSYLCVKGGISVDSSSGSAITGGPTGACSGSSTPIVASSISEVGGHTPLCCSPTPTTGALPFADPLLGAVHLPTYDSSTSTWSSPDGTPLTQQSCCTGTLQPGWYKNGINITSTTTLNPGIYVLDGGGFQVSGQADVSIGSGGPEAAMGGVFLYSGSETGGNACGPFSVTGQGIVTLSAPTSGLYKGLVFAQDPSCSTKAIVQGNPKVTVSYQGVMWLHDANFDVEGNGTNNFGQIIADTVTIAGNGAGFSAPDASHTVSATTASSVLVQ